MLFEVILVLLPELAGLDFAGRLSSESVVGNTDEYCIRSHHLDCGDLSLLIADLVAVANFGNSVWIVGFPYAKRSEQVTLRQGSRMLPRVNGIPILLKFASSTSYATV